MCKLIQQLSLVFIFVTALYSPAPAQVIERLCSKKMSVKESITVASRRRKNEKRNPSDSFLL